MNEASVMPIDPDRLHADRHDAIECRVDNIESVILGAQRAKQQAERDATNRAIGFFCGIAWTLAIYFAVRR